MKPINKLITSAAVTAFLSTQLTACGGSSNVADNAPPNEPIEISTASWGTQERIDSTVELVVDTYSRPTGGTGGHRTWATYFTIFAKNANTDNVSPPHGQFYIDIDNNPNTGYQFNNELWSSKSGADYLLEDGQLFKSTANDSSWSWQWIASKGSRINLAGHDFEPLCKKLNVGYVQLDENWKIDDFYPRASRMQAKTVSYCSVYNAKPTITMNGAKRIIVELNDPLYADPGATASDLEDGDITSQMTVTSDVDITKKGQYTIRYNVTDSGEQTATNVREVSVVKPVLGGIVIDGNRDDWAAITPLYERNNRDRHTRSHTVFKATDNQDYLYFFAAADYQYPGGGRPNLDEHWQIGIDSDNNAQTGNHKGFDYLIEDGVLLKFYGSNPYAWSWKKINGGVIASERKPFRGTIKTPVEVALAKTHMRGWSKTLRVEFLALDANWMNYKRITPDIPYVLRH